MKKIACMVLAVMLCMGLTGCSMSGLLHKDKGEEEPAEKETVEKTEENTVPPPYIGCTILSDSEKSMVELIQQAVPEQAEIDVLKYDGGDANKATVRIERSDKKGNWVTEDKGMIFLTKNIHKGPMAFIGNANSGVSIGTNPVDVVDGVERVNTVDFEPIKPNVDGDEYAETLYFWNTMPEEKGNSESRIDMTSKKVLQMSFEKHAVHERFDKVVSPESEDTKLSDITEIYMNENKKFKKAYKEQEMVAVTVEFENDANLERAPYVCEPRVDESEESETKNELAYNAGEYSGMEICLEGKIEDKWTPIGDPVSVDLDKMQGRITFSENLEKERSVTVKVGDTETTFKIPKDEEGSSEVKGIMNAIPDKDAGYISTKEKAPVMLIEEILYEDEESKTLKELFDDGVMLKDIYGNASGKYDDFYSNQGFYAITVKMVP